MTLTPLPPVSPDGLTTTGVAPNASIASSSSSASRATRSAGVASGATSASSSRANALFHSISAPARVGPDRARALREQRVDDARRERFVGADHRDVDFVGARERGHGRRVAHVADLELAARGAAPRRRSRGSRGRTNACSSLCSAMRVASALSRPPWPTIRFARAPSIGFARLRRRPGQAGEARRRGRETQQLAEAGELEHTRALEAVRAQPSSSQA